MNTSSIVLFILLLLAVFILFFQYLFRYIITYTQGESAIVIKFLHIFTVATIRYDNILSIEKVTFGQASGVFFVQRFSNRLWGDIVLIEQKNGFIKKIIVTPEDASGFIGVVKSHLAL